VELGNGDKFIFDIGLRAAERISAMQIPYDYLDKVFIGHLHADPSKRVGFSKYVTDGRVVFTDVIKFYYDQTNKMFDTDFQPPK
jgi:hypothetical protein